MANGTQNRQGAGRLPASVISSLLVAKIGSSVLFEALANALTMRASFTQYKKSLHRGSVVPTTASYADQMCRFWCLNNQCATLHQQRILFHQLRITAKRSSRHGIGSNPAVIHPQPTLEAEELYRRALTGSEDQLAPVHPDNLRSVWNLGDLLEAKGSFAGTRGISVGLCCCLGRFSLEG